jgi:hypothetical protein
MAVRLCQGEGVTEYFRNLVEEALDRQQVTVDDMTAFYVVRMLSAFARTEAARDDLFWVEAPLAVKLGQALESGGTKQRRLLRQVGDSSLFLSGFFPDCLRRSLVDVDYYASVGGYAYASLSRQEDEVLAPVFAELSKRFLQFVDVLGEVSERSSMSSPNDLLRLYERWLRTGSRRCAQLLAQQGVVPSQASGQRLMQ